MAFFVFSRVLFNGFGARHVFVGRRTEVKYTAQCQHLLHRSTQTRTAQGCCSLREYKQYLHYLGTWTKIRRRSGASLKILYIYMYIYVPKYTYIYIYICIIVLYTHIYICIYIHILCDPHKYSQRLQIIYIYIYIYLVAKSGPGLQNARTTPAQPYF